MEGSFMLEGGCTKNKNFHLTDSNGKDNNRSIWNNNRFKFERRFGVGDETHSKRDGVNDNMISIIAGANDNSKDKLNTPNSSRSQIFIHE